MSTTTVNPRQTDNSELFSSVELKYPEIEFFDGPDWIRVAKILKRAVSGYPDTDLVSIMKDVQTGDAQLWCVVDDSGDLVGAVVTRVSEFETGLISLTVQLAALERGVRIPRESMQEMIVHLEGVGRMLGCDTVRITGRKGWGAILEGYKEIHRTYENTIQETH